MGKSANRGPMCLEKQPLSTFDPKRGSLGKQDAAAPNADLSLLGDTPGPIGKNRDRAQAQCYVNRNVMTVLEVDIDETQKFLFSVAFMSEMNNQASVKGWLNKEVELGEKDKVRSAAQSQADAMMEDFYKVVQLGAAATQKFLEDKQKQKDAARTALDAKFAEALGNAESRATAFGGVVKGLAAVKFGCTAFVKITSAVTGTGAVVDIAMETAITGIDDKSSKDAKAVMLSKAATETGKELLETINEAVADQLLSKEERNAAQDFFKKYRNDKKKMAEKTAWLKKRLEVELAKGKRGAKLVAKYRKRLDKIIPAKKVLARKTAGKALAKKTVGKVFTIAFLADDLKGAWGQFVEDWNSAD